jgi:hypothetical protein
MKLFQTTATRCFVLCVLTIIRSSTSEEIKIKKNFDFIFLDWIREGSYHNSPVYVICHHWRLDLKQTNQKKGEKEEFLEKEERKKSW